ncbi:hypothetical protein AC579_4401 [Pseudocercospora musae]|uniref:Cyanovirin-N domain-containing protein n=1 Tax=Pseudocercospora musae TaxID=113226 RepID=A0A139HF45_9PEZI|nr:hypothetical protein AC579_4401 [Pseudocercospora musae]
MSAWLGGSGEDGRTWEGRTTFGNFSQTSICLHLVLRDEGVNLRCCSQTAFQTWAYNEIPLSRVLGCANGKFLYGAINFHHRARHIHLGTYNTWSDLDIANESDWLEPEFIGTQSVYNAALDRARAKALPILLPNGDHTVTDSLSANGKGDLPQWIAEKYPELAADVKVINAYRKEAEKPPPPPIMTEAHLEQIREQVSRRRPEDGFGEHVRTEAENETLEKAQTAFAVYSEYVHEAQAKPDMQASNGWPIASSAQPNAYNQDRAKDTSGYLHCELYKDDGSWEKVSLNLDDFIDNYNGQLQLRSFPAIIGISNEIGGIVAATGKSQDQVEQDMMIAVGEKIDAHPDWKIYHTKTDEEGVTMYYVGAGVDRDGEGILIKGWNAHASAAFQHFVQNKAPSRMQEVEYDAFMTEIHADVVIGEYIGVGASLNLFKGHAGPFELTLGVGLETGIGMKDHSIEVEVAGCGFTIGQHCSISVAGSSFGVDFGRCSVMIPTMATLIDAAYGGSMRWSKLEKVRSTINAKKGCEGCIAESAFFLMIVASVSLAV